MNTIEQRIQEVISRHYAMYYGGITREEIGQLGRMPDFEEIDSGLRNLLRENKIEERIHRGMLKYYPLADERDRHFTMETPEESAGMTA